MWTIHHWPLPAVGDLTRRLCAYDESVLKLSKVSFLGKCARMGHPLKLPSLTKLARLGHFPPASQAGRLASPVFYTISFLWCGSQALTRAMQLHTGAEHSGKVLFRYSELSSQYHIDASIDVNRTSRSHNKTILSQSGTVAEQNNFKI